MNKVEFKYYTQMGNAAKRNIEWLFTFETWLSWWEDTGKFSERGKKGHQYCMCRINDTGPYSPDNVYCATNIQNVQDALKNGSNPNFKSDGLGFLGKNHSEETKKIISEKSWIKHSPEEIASRVKLYNSMDMTTYGALSKYARAIGVSHTQARRFIKEHC